MRFADDIWFVDWTKQRRSAIYRFESEREKSDSTGNHE